MALLAYTLAVVTVIALYSLWYGMSQPKQMQMVPQELSAPPPMAPEPSYQNMPGFQDDRAMQNTTAPLGDNYWSEKGCGVPQLPNKQRYPSGCMLGCNPCSPLCSGEGNPCQVVAPVPSVMWQPQSASTVQYRLRTGNYVPSYCKQGGLVLRKSPGCDNASTYLGDRSPYQATCFTAQPSADELAAVNRIYGQNIVQGPSLVS